MPLDGFTMTFLKNECKNLLAGARVDRIYQLDSYSLLFNLRKDRRNYKFIISAHPQMGRFCLSEKDYPRPQEAPVFAMVLRKHLEGGILSEIKQIGQERLVHFIFDVTNELGDRVEKTLVGEFMGKHSNLILLDESQELIHDSIHRFPLTENSFREILPGKKYYGPPQENKFSLDLINLDLLREKLTGQLKDLPLQRAILSLVSGVSPLLAREICLLSQVDENQISHQLDEADYERILSALKFLEKKLLTDESQPLLIKNEERLLDFTPFSYLVYQGLENIAKPSMNALVEDFVGGRDQANKLGQKKDYLQKIIKKEILRLEKRYDLNKEKIRDLERAEEYRIWADLLTANLYQLKQGEEALVENYYSPDQEKIVITMDAQLSPNQNAQKYYKRYNKAKSGASHAQEQIQLILSETSYLESILTSIDTAGDLKTLEEIQDEMTEADLLKERNKGKQSPKKRKKAKDSLPEKIEFEGFDIYVGKNNRQNDYLTMKFATGADLWFHAKDLAGAHVLIKNPDRREIPGQVIKKAASLAAERSRGKDLRSVAVDYTLKKHVKKPKGARPGFVTYERAQTITINN